MCGIVGFTGPANRGILEGMCRRLRHRGPDDEGYFVDAEISLGMRRLAVVDPDTGVQPVANENGNIWVVFNGEIYNHQALRRDLERRGHRFRSHHSDTEVILHLYEQKGERWVDDCVGMFAVAIWDAEQRKLLLYRDRMGKKPLYYCQKNGRIYFASEIKALLVHPEVSRDPDWRALYHYFGMKNTSAPRTAFREIRQVMPGQYLVWQKGLVRPRYYWQLDFSRRLDLSVEEAGRHLLDLLDEAVQLRMQCDAPYGAYLSGGVDSSAIVSLMCKHQSSPVKTFSLGYEDPFNGKDQDLKHARKMSRRLGAEHHEYRMKAGEVPEMLPLVMRSFDEPFSGVISTYFLSILMHRHIKVALSGDGADELFGSYLTHRMSWPMKHYLRLVASGRRDEAAWTDRDRRQLGEFATGEKLDLLKRVADRDLARWRSQILVFDDAERRELLEPDFLENVQDARGGEIYEDLAHGTTARDPLNACLEIDQKELLPNQVLPFVDRLSMAHSIEVRVPFLDHRIVEFAEALPARHKIDGAVCKHVLKHAVDGMLPDELVNRPKEGFVLPIYSWMRTSLRPYVEETLDPGRVARHGLLRPEAVQHLLYAHYEDSQDHSAKLWNLVCFQVWWETCMAA